MVCLGKKVCRERTYLYLLSLPKHVGVDSSGTRDTKSKKDGSRSEV